MLSCNCTKLADLAFLYCFVVKSNINSAKSLPQMGIECATLGLWHPLSRSNNVILGTSDLVFFGKLANVNFFRKEIFRVKVICPYWRRDKTINPNTVNLKELVIQIILGA